jgi:hypothetical protein
MGLVAGGRMQDAGFPGGEAQLREVKKEHHNLRVVAKERFHPTSSWV